RARHRLPGRRVGLRRAGRARRRGRRGPRRRLARRGCARPPRGRLGRRAAGGEPPVTSPTPARTRLAWAQLPAHVQQAVVEQVGAGVVDATSHEGGYSPGMAATLRTAAGERVFVKAVSSGFHERSAELYRDEARVNGLLPDGVPAPRMRWEIGRASCRERGESAVGGVALKKK